MQSRTKTILSFLTFGVLAAGSSAVFAQDPAEAPEPPQAVEGEAPIDRTEPRIVVDGVAPGDDVEPRIVVDGAAPVEGAEDADEPENGD